MMIKYRLYWRKPDLILRIREILAKARVRTPEPEPKLLQVEDPELLEKSFSWLAN